MNRKEFVKACAILGIGLPLQAQFISCRKDDENQNCDGTSGSSGKVLIIGAGAAGLCTGHLLKQQGIDFEIIEASSVYGGRTKTHFDFVDFPIPLGAEWLHMEPSIFNTAVNDESVNVDVPTTMYDQDNDYGLYNGIELTPAQIGFTIDQKFIGGTWYTFLDEYIVPNVLSNITFNTAAQSIDYSGDKIQVATNNGNFTADKVIVATPVKILQNGAISFSPSLPSYKQEAIDNVTVWDGFKAFIEFSEKFYPAFLAYDVVPETAGQKLYYDASYGQQSDRHVLGLFSVGTPALEYGSMSNEALIAAMLAELDEEFDGAATANYIQHTRQFWNDEPHINGAYVYDYENWQRVRDLGDSVDDKIYFAGDAYTDGEDWSSVHTAILSAKRAVEELVEVGFG